MRNNIHFICLKIHCKWCGKVVSKDSETLDIPQDSVVSNIAQQPKKSGTLWLERKKD